MWKKKSHLQRCPDWSWITHYRGFYNPWNYRRRPRGRHQWVSQFQLDAMESRESGITCSVRPRSPFELPSAWDDVKHSQYYFKSWKDVTKKRKQWEK